MVDLHCFHGTEPELNVQIRCCIDEWKDGVQKKIFLDSRIYDRVYEAILADMKSALKEEYSGEKLLKTLTTWWDQAMYAATSLIYIHSFLTSVRKLCLQRHHQVRLPYL